MFYNKEKKYEIDDVQEESVPFLRGEQPNADHEDANRWRCSTKAKRY